MDSTSGSLFNNPDFSDVTLRLHDNTRETSFPAHLQILANRSKFFQSYARYPRGSVIDVNLSEIGTVEDALAVIEYIYNNNCITFDQYHNNKLYNYFMVTVSLQSMQDICADISDLKNGQLFISRYIPLNYLGYLQHLVDMKKALGSPIGILFKTPDYLFEIVIDSYNVYLNIYSNRYSIPVLDYYIKFIDKSVLDSTNSVFTWFRGKSDHRTGINYKVENIKTMDWKGCVSIFRREEIDEDTVRSNEIVILDMLLNSKLINDEIYKEIISDIDKMDKRLESNQ